PVPGSLSSLLHLHNRQRQPMPASMPGTLPNPTMPGSSAVLMPMERQMSMNSNIMGMQGPNLNNPCASPQVPPMHSEAKMQFTSVICVHNHRQHKCNRTFSFTTLNAAMIICNLIPYLLFRQHCPSNATAKPHQSNMQGDLQNVYKLYFPSHFSIPLGNFPPSSPPAKGLLALQVSPAAQQMQPTQTVQPPQPTGGRRRRVVDEDPDERRRKFLERNRAAATRCRQKRKVWVMSLEKKAEELTQTNMQLQNEVSMLKNEVAQLKQLLLTHKDCPITAMQKESQGYLSPESSPPASPVPACSQQQVIQHNTITTSSSVSDVVGSSTLTQLASHRTDINPIL
ncbi:ATF7 factor, partial [Certhia familiaris]|nr:ATF7 factor [Certhia familiaris]